MTSLFRPWTSEEVVPCKSGFNGLRADKPTSESPLTLTDGACSDADKKFEINIEDREVRYKSVKEHMRKRSEKYWLKRCKLTEELKPEITVKPEPGTQWPEVSCASFPVPGCAPATGFLNPGLDFLTPENILPPYDVRCHPIHSGSDFVDAALSQGFPGNLFEEYARFLTEQQKQVAERTRKQRPKKFRCPHCQVGFSNNGQLKGHIRIHTGERPYKCDAESCGKSFTRNEELTRHRRIHSGLRPFPCSECGKRFGRKDHLKKHVKTHFQQRYQLVPILTSHYPYYGYGL